MGVVSGCVVGGVGVGVVSGCGKWVWWVWEW